jgi:hypothetical protein
MDFVNPVSFQEAVKHWLAKQVLPTGLNSREIAQQLSAAVRRQSVFSAETTLTGYLDQIQQAVGSILEPKQVVRSEERGALSVTEGLNPATAREQLRRTLQGFGFSPAAGTEGTIKDLSSDARINLVVKTNVELAQGAGKFVQGNLNEDVVDLWPAWELVRYEDRDKPRDWETRWKIAAEVSGDAKAMGCLGNMGRMCALKSSGIWQALGDGAGGYEDTLGNPYPPFAFNSGMWTEDVSRDEAVELGLIGESEPARPAALDLGSLFKEAA